MTIASTEHAALASNVRPLRSDRVLAVVVTYEPDQSLITNLQALRDQVDALLVVDNASTDFAFIERACSLVKCRVIRNSANLGVATALNQAVQIAEAEGFSWLATFDQDSLVSPDAIQGLIDLYKTLSLSRNIAAMVMTPQDRAFGASYEVFGSVLEESSEWRSVRTAITSGGLIPVGTLKELGGFDDGLFIDSVDHDFYSRCRRNGYLVIEGKKQTLLHSLGRMTRHRLLGWPVKCSNHSATRRYYMTRNQLEMVRRGWRHDPFWALKGLAHLFGDSTTALIFEDQRRSKLVSMLKGGWHFLTRRFGPIGK